MGNLYVIEGLFFPQHWTFGSGRESIRPCHVLLKPPGPFSFALLPHPDPAILCIDLTVLLLISLDPLMVQDFLGLRS